MANDEYDVSLFSLCLLSSYSLISPAPTTIRPYPLRCRLEPQRARALYFISIHLGPL